MSIEISRSRILIAVAHPDDELLFFGGLIQRLSASGFRIDVACATSHFASSVLTSARRAEFHKSCWTLRTHATLLGFRDGPEPLPIAKVATRLQAMQGGLRYAAVYTHGVWGEYGHRHHRDVSLAVHHTFPGVVFSLAGPLEADLSLVLTADELEKKRALVRSTYLSQAGVANWCSSEERFVRLRLEVAQALIAIANGETLSQETREAESLGDLVLRCRGNFDTTGIPGAEVANIPREIWQAAYRTFASRLKEVATASALSK